MRVSKALLLVPLVILTCLLVLSPAAGAGQAHARQDDKPPDFQGGGWSDDFYTSEWLLKTADIDLSWGHLVLKLEEPLHWTQTWTVHFSGGQFWHTEAISESVRLAPDGTGGFFTAGVYTSTVFSAGRPVDWSAVEWTFEGVPGMLTVEYRTGNSPQPDASWTAWATSEIKPWEYVCVYVYGGETTECEANMAGIDSSAYIQYRALFDSGDPSTSVALRDIDVTYGIHAAAASALSVLVSPVDLLAWTSVMLTATVPASTTLVVDILAADGAVLLHDVRDGEDLAGIDALLHPVIQLRAALATLDPSLTPDIDLWGLRWSVKRKLWLPVILR